MSKAKAKHQKMLSGGEIDHGPGFIKSTNSSLSKFNPRYATRSTGTTTTTAPYKDAILKTNDVLTTTASATNHSEPWMETVTSGKFEDFQRVIVNIVDEISSKPENANHHFTKQWNKLRHKNKNPMTAITKWRSINKLGFADIFAYKDFLQQCPNIVEYIQFAPSRTTKQGFAYGIIERPATAIAVDNSTLPSSSTSLDSPSSTTGTDTYVTVFSDGKVLTAETTVINEEDMEKKPPEQNQVESPLILTPKQTNVNLLPQVVVTNSSTLDTIVPLGQPSFPSQSTHDDIPEDAEIAWTTKDDAPGFRKVHYRLFETITTWFQQEETDRHPFYMKWRKATYKGLDATTAWSKVAKILNISYLKDYIAFMNECPRVRERYELQWDYFDNAVKYKELELPVFDEVNQDINRLNGFQRQMQNMLIRFDTIVKEVENKVDAISFRSTTCEENILNKVSTRFANNVTHHMTRISDYAANIMKDFQV
jgi:hypothetical protein